MPLQGNSILSTKRLRLIETIVVAVQKVLVDPDSLKFEIVIDLLILIH